MKNTFFVFICLILTSGCATGYQKVALQEEDFKDKPLAITLNVPFEEQTPNLCGPTALYMVSKPLRPELTVSEVTQLSLTASARGTYKQDLLAAARRLGFAPYRVTTFAQMIDELSQEKPIVLFHRTKFLWKDYWHYSVVTGYHRKAETMSLHIGPYENHDSKISDVIGSWVEGGSWAYVILKPGDLPKIAEYQPAIENALAFLRLGNVDAAYDLSEQVLKRWPERYEADVVMAEALLKKNEAKKALISLKKAFRKEPGNPALKQKIRELSQN